MKQIIINWYDKMNVIQFIVPEKHYSELLFNLLKTIPYVKDVKSFDLKDEEYSNSTIHDMNTISLSAVCSSFNDLGTDDDFKEWINAPKI